MALEFTNSGEFITASSTSSFIGLTELSVVVLIKSNVTSTDHGFFIGETPVGNDESLALRYDAAGFYGGGTNLIKFGVETSVGNLQLESSNNTQTTDFQHLVGRWQQNSDLELIIDGVLDTPTFVGPEPGEPSNSNTGTVINVPNLIIGKGAKDTGSSDSWDGIVDYVRVYNRYLSDAEVNTIYLSDGTDNIYDGLILYYNFRESEAGSLATGTNSIKDISPDKNHATPSNNPIYATSILKTRPPTYYF